MDEELKVFSTHQYSNKYALDLNNSGYKVEV